MSTPTTPFTSYMALGDSFTEGLGDYYHDGSERGWADLLALALADELGEGHDHGHAADATPFQYSNLAIRGRLLAPIIAEQLPVALQSKPALASFNGGGNDMLRPSMDNETVARMYRETVEKMVDAGIHVLALAGPDPGRHLPRGGTFTRRGEAMTSLLHEWAETTEGITFCDNFHDMRLREPDFWSPDGLHLNTRGHASVAVNALTALGRGTPAWLAELTTADVPPTRFGTLAYYGEHVVPFLGRRLMRKSSGDGRFAKRPALAPLDPAARY